MQVRAALHLLSLICTETSQAMNVFQCQLVGGVNTASRFVTFFRTIVEGIYHLKCLRVQVSNNKSFKAAASCNSHFTRILSRVSRFMVVPAQSDANDSMVHAEQATQHACAAAGMHIN